MMYSVRPWLYIGKYQETRDLSLLQHHQIGAMLHLADIVNQPGIETLCMVIEDGIKVDPVALRRGVDFIRLRKADGLRVLVACGAGISRSVTFAIAALKEEEQITQLEAFQEILRHHPDAMPHPALWESLRAYYQETVSYVDMWEEIHKLRGIE